MNKSTSIFFIIDGPRLEAQATMLASTLKLHASDCKLIAYVRRDKINTLSHLTHKILEKCNVELRVLPYTRAHESLWKTPYPIGNKILAASDFRNTQVSVFLDTDIVLTRPVDFYALLGESEVAAVVSDYNTGGMTQNDWQDIYDFFGVELPEERVQLWAGRRLRTLPYYNAGVLIFKELSADHEMPFGQHWLENAVRFENTYQGHFSHESIDQITLPVTAFARGSAVKSLPQDYNFNIQAREIKKDIDPAILHYHSMKFLWRTPKSRTAIITARTLLGEKDFDEFRETYWSYIFPRKFRNLIKPESEEEQQSNRLA